MIPIHVWDFKKGPDCLIIVANSPADIVDKAFASAKEQIDEQIDLDPSLAKSPAFVVQSTGTVIRRVIFARTGCLGRDYDDERRWTEAGASGLKKAIACGCTNPALAVQGNKSSQQQLLALLGVLDAAYVPLEVRESGPGKPKKISAISCFLFPEHVCKMAQTLDYGKIVAKDIGGSDPERMAPEKAVQYCAEHFGKKESSIKMDVISDKSELTKQYPLFAAVDRCARMIPRHAGRIIFLHYKSGTPKNTAYLVGKGVTYDTGGADIKAGGVMAGMHRDKCGAAAVAGYFKFLDEFRPDNLEVTGALCMVRNSVGADAYVADEIITSRAGKRIRIGNTDAEGRMAMADSLCLFKEKALAEYQPGKMPHLMTVATLTGHCVVAWGEGYTALMPNGPARHAGIPARLQVAGESLGEPVEISSIRREDFAFHAGPSEYEDVLQCNNLPSSRTPRGSQSPAAFLMLASGLDKHGRESTQPLSFTHMDVAASAGPFPGLPTGAPIMALAKTFSPEIFEGISDDCSFVPSL